MISILRKERQKKIKPVELSEHEIQTQIMELLTKAGYTISVTTPAESIISCLVWLEAVIYLV